MFKKIFLFILLYSIFLDVMTQTHNANKLVFSIPMQNKFKNLVEEQKLDSAYLFLKTNPSQEIDYYLSWKNLATAYWTKGDFANSTAIAVWVNEKTSLFKNPNELYPQLHHLIGNIYFSQNRLDSAIANYQKTIHYREKYTHIHDTALLDTYQNLSQIYSLKSDSLNTFTYLDKARDIVYLQTNNLLQIASINGRFGDSYARLGDYDLAKIYYKEGIGVLSASNPKHSPELFNLYIGQGKTSHFSGKYLESIYYFEKALTFYNSTSFSELDQAKLFELLGDSYYMLKDYEIALEFYLKSNAILSKNLPAKHYRITANQTDLAATYKGLEDYKNAIVFFRLAEANGKLSAYQCRVFGETLWNASQFKEAEALLTKANTLAESNLSSDKKELADTHFWLGSFYLQTQRNEMLGLYYVNLSIGEYRALFGEKNEPLGRALLALAKYFVETNNTQTALEIIQNSIIALTPGFDSHNVLMNPQGVQLSVQSVTNSLGWKALTLAHHYEKTKDLRYLKTSFETYQLALKMVEGFRMQQKYSSNLILNKEVETLLNHAILVSNKLYSLTKEANYFEATFRFIEQNKSTALLAGLQKSNTLRLANVPSSLIERENQLKQNLLSIQEKISSSTSKLSSTENKLQQIFKQQQEVLQKNLDSIQSVLYEQYPDYYRLFYGNNVISIAQVQSHLDKNKVILDFALSDSLLITYVIRKDDATLTAKKLPAGFNNSIERLLQLIRFVNTDNSKADFQSFTQLSYRIYEFLFADIEEQLQGKELLFVPDGILSYLPFDVLLTEKMNLERPDYRKLPYFIRTHVSSTLNSAAIYFSYSQNKKRNYGQIVAFAPDYSFLEGQAASNNNPFSLTPLNHVNQELESISNAFDAKIYKGNQATKENFLSSAKQASVLHLAMHAVLNDEDPFLSQLVFAPKEQEFNSSLFLVSDLFGMTLSADLAVLSACNSGNGKLNKGEGILSLSTGFQYAGVPSIIMTHWDVNDKFSAELMSNFYANLAQGMTKNKALHQAKLKIIQQENALYSHPYYWAGFTLIGNETAIVAGKSKFGNSLEFIIPLLILAFLFLRKKQI
jgi:CHAT domain-containing protein